AAGKQLYLGKIWARQRYSYSGNPTPIPIRLVLRLYDRLYHAGVTLSGGSQTATLNGPAVTRGPANGVDNELWIELYTAVASGTITVTYVNQSGVNATTPAFDLSGVSYDGSGGRAAQLLLAAGDTGVRSIVSVTSSGLPSYPSNSHQEALAILCVFGHYNYILQGNRKTEEGGDHPDRDAQFRHINRAVKHALRAGEPVISVDTKKKELIGNYQNRGRQWRQTGTADKVNGHDFPGPEVPRAYPYGIYDLGRNAGFVNVGTDHDTGAFAVASIRGWWRAEGRRLYPRVRQLLITADRGGSNGWGGGVGERGGA